MFPNETRESLKLQADNFERCLLVAYDIGRVIDKNTIEYAFTYRWRVKEPNWFTSFNQSQYKSP